MYIRLRDAGSEIISLSNEWLHLSWQSNSCARITSDLKFRLQFHFFPKKHVRMNHAPKVVPCQISLRGAKSAECGEKVNQSIGNKIGKFRKWPNFACKQKYSR